MTFFPSCLTNAVCFCFSFIALRSMKKLSLRISRVAALSSRWTSRRSCRACQSTAQSDVVLAGLTSDARKRSVALDLIPQAIARKQSFIRKPKVLYLGAFAVWVKLLHTMVSTILEAGGVRR